MRKALLEFLRCPASGAELDLYPLEEREFLGESDVTAGLLVTPDRARWYPIVQGVPVMLEKSVPRRFKDLYAEQLRDAGLDIPGDQLEAAGEDFSFAAEWNRFFELGLTRTWGRTVDERLGILLLETNLTAADLEGKLVLDGGCGNGLLTQGLSSLGCTVVGFDYAESIFRAEANRTSAAVHYVRGDVNRPPFRPGIFDLVYSSGVLHHTPDTRRAFAALSRVVKDGGSFYVLVYRWTREFVPTLYNIVTEAFRLVTCRLSGPRKMAVVKWFTGVTHRLLRLYGDYQNRTYDELLISVYDSLTPRHAHRHTPVEMAWWFFENGFGAPALTHWDNYNGFGMVGVKSPLADTPGANFGKPGVTRRYAR